MKNYKILGSSVIAGTLLLGGVGAGHVDAAEELTKSQANQIAQDAANNNNDENVRFNDKDTDHVIKHDDHYDVHYSIPGHNGPSKVEVYKDGTVKDYRSDDPTNATVSHYDEDQFSSQQQNDHQAEKQNNAQNEQQSQNATQEIQSTQGVNNQVQSQQQLPESGKEDNTAINVSIGAIALVLGLTAIASRRVTKQ